MSLNGEGFKGAIQKGVGSTKEAVGRPTGNEELPAQGVAGDAAGTVKKGVGKAKDAVHKATQ